VTLAMTTILALALGLIGSGQREVPAEVPSELQRARAERTRASVGGDTEATERLMSPQFTTPFRSSDEWNGVSVVSPTTDCGIDTTNL